MRQLSIQVGAAWLCVCCVLPSFEGVDRLPESAGGTAGTAGADTGGIGNLGGHDGETSDGGDANPASAGMDNGGSASSGSGGVESSSGNENGGSSSGVGGAGSDWGGTGGATAGTAGGGGTSAGTAGAGGMAGTGGAPTAGCSKYCKGADSVLTICGSYSPPAKIDTEAKCFGTCAKAAAADVTCWNVHVGNAKAATGGTVEVHCEHAFGLSVCGPLP
jgi:hypothetical protein